MPRIFADSSVLIAGSDSRSGASRAIIVMAEIGLFQLVISRYVITECERNLRKKLPAGLPIFAQLLTNINLLIVDDPPPTEVERWFPHIEAKDAPILAAAVQAKVDRLLTLNSKDFTPQVAMVSGLTIQPPGEFVREIRAIVKLGLL